MQSQARPKKMIINLLISTPPQATKVQLHCSKMSLELIAVIIFEKALEHLHLMMEEPKILGFCTQMLFIAKELERIGDLSKVISKEVIYNLKGKLVKR